MTTAKSRQQDDNPPITDEHLASQGRALAASIGVTVTVPAEALAAALADESYYNLLFLHRESPEELEWLLANPPREGAPVPGVPPRSSSAMIRSAVGAYWRWGRAGFPQVALEVIERRENACLACPNFAEPTHALQKVATLGWSAELIGRRTVGRVCSLCSCGIARKIRLPSAACPAADPASPGLTRWGDPVAAPESH